MANVPETSICQECAAGLDCDVHGNLLLRRGREASREASRARAEQARAAVAKLANQGPRQTAVIAYFTLREAAALAQLVKRITWNELSANAIDHDEAELMRDAIERLRRGLADSGFDPR